VTTTESAELRELKSPNKLLEQEIEVMRPRRTSPRRICRESDVLAREGVRW
jgi:hypothetical protein